MQAVQVASSKAMQARALSSPAWDELPIATTSAVACNNTCLRFNPDCHGTLECLQEHTPGILVAASTLLLVASCSPPQVQVSRPLALPELVLPPAPVMKEPAKLKESGVPKHGQDWSGSRPFTVRSSCRNRRSLVAGCSSPMESVINQIAYADTGRGAD